MNKAIGWSLIVLSSALFIIMFLGGFVVHNLVVVSFELGTFNFFPIALIVIYLSALAAIGFLLRLGIIKLKKSSHAELIPYIGNISIHYKGKLNFYDYRNYLIFLTISKPLNLIVTSFFILLSISAILNHGKLPLDTGNLFWLLLASILFSPIYTIIYAYRSLKTNAYFHQEFEYTITNEGITMKGDTASSTVVWANFFKIIETKKLFVLYSGVGIASFLEKRYFSASEIIEFQKFIQSLPIKK